MSTPGFRARRLPRQPGPAAWAALLPPAPPPVPLEADGTADVAVIGAGFAGLSAARRLMQIDPGLRIAVLEAGRVGEGPAGRNSGFMIDLPHDLASEDYGGADDAAVIARNREAIAFARAAAAEYGLDRAVFDPAGKVNAAAGAGDDAHNRSYAATLAGLGEAHEMLDAGAMREMTGSPFYTSGLYTPETVMIQPAAYVRGLAAGLAQSSNRLTIHGRCCIECLDAGLPPFPRGFR